MKKQTFLPCGLTCPLSPGHPVDIISPLELRVAELMHHMKIEAAVGEGAKNVVRQLSDRRIQERRVLSEVTVLTEGQQT